MSNHFTYEIDERNLRMQLKDMEVPTSEDAWQKFETFSGSQAVQRSSAGIRTISLNLNRNVVLPLVFGVIIVSFSLMLVNFISIKNPTKESEQKVEVMKPSAITPPAAPARQEPKIAATPALSEPTVPTEQKAQTTSAANHAANMPGDKMEVRITSQIVSEPEKVTLVSNDNATQIQTAGANAEIETEAETPVKKKRKRSTESVNADQLQAIQPVIVSDDQETEVRPN